MAVTNKYPVVAPRRRTVRGKLYEQYKIMAGRREDGSPWVEYRSTLAAAEERAEEIRSYQSKMRMATAALSSRQLYDAASAFGRLPAGVTLARVVDFYLASAQRPQPPTIARLYDELRVSQARKGLSLRSVQTLSYRVGPFVERYGELSADAVGLREIEAWMNGLGLASPVSWNGYRRYLMVLFGFAVKRGYISVNPVKQIDVAKVPYHEPQYVGVNDVRRLLERAQVDEHADRILPRMAIGFFAGVRTSELDEIDWRNVDLEARCLRIVKTKRVTMPRVVDIESNLVEWLLPFSKPEGPIGVKELAFHRWRRAACKKLLVKWPDNAMRHSFATYHVARYEDAPRTAFQMGHMNDVKMLYHHYRGLASKKDGEEYFSIRPAAQVAQGKPSPSE